MPDALAPVDTSVALPPSVLRAAEVANAAHAAAYQTTPAPQPDQNPAPQPTPPPQPDQNPAPQPTPPPQPSRPEDRHGVDPASWEGRFYSMEGRYRQSQTTIGSLQEQLSELGDDSVKFIKTSLIRPLRLIFNRLRSKIGRFRNRLHDKPRLGYTRSWIPTSLIGER